MSCPWRPTSTTTSSFPFFLLHSGHASLLLGTPLCLLSCSPAFWFSIQGSFLSKHSCFSCFCFSLTLSPTPMGLEMVLFPFGQHMRIPTGPLTTDPGQAQSLSVAGWKAWLCYFDKVSRTWPIFWVPRHFTSGRGGECGNSVSAKPRCLTGWSEWLR